MAETSRKAFQVRSFVSLLLVLVFVWLACSGLVLYLGPAGGVARRTGWSFWGFGRDDWMAQHMATSAAFAVAVLAHIWLNRRPLWVQIRSRAGRFINRRWELLVAAAVTAFLVVGTIQRLPPVSWVLSGSRHLTAYRTEARQLQHVRQGPGGASTRSDRPGGGRGPGRGGGGQGQGGGGRGYRGGR